MCRVEVSRVKQGQEAPNDLPKTSRLRNGSSLYYPISQVPQSVKFQTSLCSPSQLKPRIGFG